MKRIEAFPTLLAFCIGTALGRRPPAIVQVILPDGRVVSDFVEINL